jgi:hypothetical protein
MFRLSRTGKVVTVSTPSFQEIATTRGGAIVPERARGLFYSSKGYE